MTVVHPARVGEGELLRTLHDEHAGALLAYVTRLTGDRGRAEDVVQETLLRAWRHPTVLEESAGSRSPRAWLFTVARRLVIDDWRARRSRPEVSTADPPEQVVADASSRIVEESVVASALRTLSSEHREVLLECYYRGASVGDAALNLGIPAGTVKSRTHYALRALKAALDQLGALS
jgi:RNA polymerase sigma-70 factor (ECF subfamily)